MRAAFPIVGRARELDLADRALDDALGGDAVGLLISGAPGIGKTRLATEIAARASTRGAVVAKGSAWDLGGAPPFWPWTQALAALAPRELVERALDGSDARFSVLDACTRLVRTAAAHSPVVVWLEDLHAADAPTIVLARFLLRHVDAPFALIATHRTHASAPLALGELARDCASIRLRGLDASEVGALVASRTGTTPTAGDVDTIARSTEGHPLFVIELSESPGALSALRTHTPLVLPSSLRHAIEAHLVTLGPVTREVVAALATLAPEHASLVGALAEVDARTTESALAEARAAGVLGAGHAFAHALFGEVLLEGSAPDARASRHARAAQLLASHLPDHPTTPAERARHLLAAGPAHRVEAIEAALVASERASHSAGYEESARWAEAALAQLEAGGVLELDRRARAEILLGLAVRAIGRRDEGTRHLELAIAHGRTAGRVDLVARAAVAIARGGTGLVLPTPTVRGALEDAARELAPESALRVEVLSALALALRAAPGDPRGPAAAAEAVALAERLGDGRVLARALDASLTAGYGAENLDRRLEIGARLVTLGEHGGDRTTELDGRRWRVGACIERGDVARASTEIDLYLRVAHEGRLPGPRINATSRAAQVALLEGRYDVGESLAREACAIGVRAGDPASEFLLAAQLVVPLGDRGRVDELRLSMPPVRAALASLTHTVVPRVVVAAQLAFSGEHELARHEARLACAELAGGSDDFVRQGLLALLVWVGSLVGLSGDELASLERELQPYADRVATAGSAFALGSTERYLGLAAERRGDLSAARAHLGRAVDANVALGARPYEARSRLELARVLRALGDDGEAHESRGHAIADEIGLLVSRGGPSARTGGRIHGTFRREGQSYRVGLGDRTVLVRESRGLGYLATLVGRAGDEVHALALASPTEAVDERGIPMLDAEAKEAYRERVVELREIVDEAEAANDLGRAERARVQLDQLTRELARAVGLGGRDRRAGATSERARMAVRVAIRRALDALAREHPPLAAHLERSVRTGAFCAYDPDPSVEIDWNLG